jgi:hypothetical protein
MRWLILSSAPESVRLENNGSPIHEAAYDYSRISGLTISLSFVASA